MNQSFVFYKYQGTGNDFVMVDNRAGTFDRRAEALVRQLCHRRFGIGADGLILLQNHPAHDFEMIYFNADGREGSLCGNGARCTVAFARSLGLIGVETTFQAADGPHYARVGADGLVHLQMPDVGMPQPYGDDYFLDTGSPHYVRRVADVAAVDVLAEGRRLRYDPAFAPSGTNVNFVAARPDGTLAVRTYERGVEAETFSCGTGVTAVALVMGHGTASGQPRTLHTPGGTLRVTFARTDQGYTDVFLIGPARQVFEGRIAAAWLNVFPGSEIDTPDLIL